MVPLLEQGGPPRCTGKFMSMCSCVYPIRFILLTFMQDQNGPPFKPLSSSAPKLLSHIYRCLQHHIEQAASKEIIAVLAFVLTMSSRQYFTRLGESLGLSHDARALWLRRDATEFKPEDYYVPSLDDIVSENLRAITMDSNEEDQELPIFFHRNFSEALPAARKSLQILHIANPNFVPQSSQTCKWVWSHNDVEKLWEFQSLHNSEVKVSFVGSDTPFQLITSSVMPDRSLEGLHLFDLEPGTDVHQMAPASLAHSAISKFIENFPSRLHPLTPTLDHLSQLVLRPLAAQAESLSNSVLHLYLTKLHVEKHLILMRSFMLVTLPGFKRRLVQALFTDVYERGYGKRVLFRRGLDRELAEPSVNTSSPHGIGINPDLSERNSWPPRGADLSFSLRNVIDESLAERSPGYESEADNDIWLHGESRLGFSIRDLPVEDGRERWLNPMSK